jgi:anti-anti-sigma factor
MVDEFAVVVRGTSTYVVLTGEVDLGSTPALMRALDRAFAARTDVVIDLESVTFIDSAALGYIIDGHRQARAAGLGYRIASTTTPGIARVLEIAGLGIGPDLQPEDERIPPQGDGVTSSPGDGATSDGDRAQRS